MNDEADIVRSSAELEALYGAAAPASILKEQPFLHPLYAEFVKAAPFAILATSGADGLDASPRGDRPGFVEIVDAKTLLMPDRRGNNRIDSLRNILTDPRVGLLFLIPGVAETLRINGRASISIAPDLLDRFTVDGKPPKTVMKIRIETVFFQCARAIVRSGLWDVKRQVARSSLPSAGEILSALSQSSFDGESYDRALDARVRETLY